MVLMFAINDAQLSRDAKPAEALDNRRFVGWLRRGRGPRLCAPRDEQRARARGVLELAIRYSDDTILERHHCAAAFSVLREPRFDVFSHLTTDERKQARALVIELILMTDLARHGEFIARRLKPLLPRGFKANKESQDFVRAFHDQDAPFLLTVAVKFAI